MLRLNWSSAVTILAFTACAGGAKSGSETHGDAAQVAPAASATAADTSDPRLHRADLARIMGDSSAPVWMVMASDFQCPYCKWWHDSVGPVINHEYVTTGKLRLAYVIYPILPKHINAVGAAEAALCAGAQGKFWEYGDKLFATQDEWAFMPPGPGDVRQPKTSDVVFARLASEQGLDTASFGACVHSHVMIPMIEADRARARAAGVNGTPTFFIGKHVIDMAKPAAFFRPVIDSALAEAAAGAAKPAR
jgi:protein-disulfide isomerase